MKKPITIVVVVFLAVITVVYVFSFYPIARVNGEFLLQRDFSERADALERFEAKSRAAAGSPILSAEDYNRLRQGVLENMVGTRILEQYAASRADFSAISAEAENLVRTTLQSADVDTLPKATQELYGWSVDEFRKYVLYPQAFQNVLVGEVEESGTNFGEFLTAELAKAHVRLFFVPWEWHEGRLQEKE